MQRTHSTSNLTTMMPLLVSESYPIPTTFVLPLKPAYELYPTSLWYFNEVIFTFNFDYSVL